MSWNQLILLDVTIVLQVALFVLAFSRGLQERLPLFFGYIGLLCLGTFVRQLVFNHYGFQSVSSYYGYWMVTGVLIVARGFAIADLCRYELRAYRGVWALTWRILGCLAILTFLNAFIDASGKTNWISPFVLAISRDVAISSIAVLGALLLIRRYYGIRMENFETRLAGGMLFFCLVDVANQSLMQNVLLANAGRWLQVRSQILPIYHVWDDVRSLAFIVAMGVWCFALLRPLPAPAQTPPLLSQDVYAELSPAINLQLRSYSDRLLEMLKI